MATRWGHTIAGLTLAAGVTGQAAASPPSFAVGACNQAGVAADTLARAKSEVTRIYGEVGVDVIWKDPEAVAPAGAVRALTFVTTATVLVSGRSQPPHLRSDNQRISCFYLMPGTRNLVIHIDPRQPIRIVAASLAHELYHVAEIERAPEVVDSDSLRGLYERIGERSCQGQSGHDCWETRAAKAFQELVMRQLAGDRPKTLPRRTTGEDRAQGARRRGSDAS